MQDLESLVKQQKSLIEKAEQAQQNDMKNAAKRLRSEQVNLTSVCLLTSAQFVLNPS